MDPVQTRLRGQTLNTFAPALIWALAAANMVLAAWSVLDGLARVLATAAAVALAGGSALAFVRVAPLLRDQVPASIRIMLYGALVGGMVGAAWTTVPAMPWFAGTEADPVQSEPVALVPTNALSPPYVPAGPDRLPHVPENVMQLITESRHALAGMDLDVSKCSGPGDGALACRGDYLLAVTNQDGEVAYVSLYEKRAPSVPGYKVTLGGNGGRATGVNPDVVVKHPPGITVLALKTAINWAGSATWAVYVPYSPEIDTPEVRAAGVAYLWSQVKKAEDELRADGMRSQYFDELVADAIPADHVFTLVLTENVSLPEPFRRGGSNVDRLRLLNEALAQLGANQSKAWDYRASSAGARGKGQFIQKTYVDLCAIYRIDCPEHAVGARDDNLVFKLMFLHADDEWGGIKNKSWLRGKPMLMRLYLAAGYNGFYGNAAKSIRACGTAKWREPKPACSVPLRPETRPYLDKYEWIYGQHFDAAQHDAVAAEVYPLATVETTPEADREENE